MDEIFHSVKLIDENCIGCNQCMIKCPVQAIRLKNSKAVIYADKCIDCGECIKSCQYKAHVAQKDKIEVIQNYKAKIAIPSVTVYTQFGTYVNPRLVNAAIRDLGFDEVFDMTYACDIASTIMKREIQKLPRPAISTFCPTVERLIESDYPGLTEHLIKMPNPIEIGANIIREKYKEKGFSNDEIGVFYISSCVTWVTKAKYTALNENFRVDASIAFSDVYGDILRYITKNADGYKKIPMDTSYSGLKWGISGGQCDTLKDKECLVVDEISNVILTLDDMEKDKFHDVDFVEATACSCGCVGGLFVVDNPFNAKRIVNKFKGKLQKSHVIKNISNKEYKHERDGEEKKASKKMLDEDFQSAFKKMKYMNKLINALPGLDCGQCGSPTCRAFAEDVVRGLAEVNECKMKKLEGDLI